MCRVYVTCSLSCANVQTLLTPCRHASQQSISSIQPLRLRPCKNIKTTENEEACAFCLTKYSSTKVKALVHLERQSGTGPEYRISEGTGGRWMRWVGSTRKEYERDKSLRNVWDGIYDWEEEEFLRKGTKSPRVYSYTSITPRRSSVYTYIEKKSRREKEEKYEHYTHTSKKYGVNEKDERRRSGDYDDVPRRKSICPESYVEKPRRKNTYGRADTELDRDERIKDVVRWGRRKSVRFKL